MPEHPRTRRTRLFRRLAPLFAVSALALGATACGDDEDEASAPEEETASAEQVTVTATEYDFELSATPTAETTEVTFDNQGKEGHALVFARLGEGFTVDEAFELQGEKGSAVSIAEAQAGPGESKAIEVKKAIEPGNYVMLCPIGGPKGPHYKLGQLEEFEIG